MNNSNNNDLNRLLEKYAKDSISKKELKLLSKLLQDSDAKNILDEYVLKCYANEELDIDIDIADDLFERILEKTETKETKVNTIKKPILYNNLVQYAAVFVGILAICGLAYYLFIQEKNDVIIAYQTNVGEQKTITLPDGTKVVLNVASKISYSESFGDKNREVQLLGEAFFDVVRNENKPFIIHTRNLATNVLGTSFNIKAYNDDDIQVSVKTGRVEVSSDALEGTKGETSQAMVLQSGEQVVYGMKTGQLSKESVDISLISAWADGTLVFENTPFIDVINSLERWYGVDILLENKSLSNCEVRSKWNNASLENVLETLGFILNVEHEQKDNKIVLKGGTCSS